MISYVDGEGRHGSNPLHTKLEIRMMSTTTTSENDVARLLAALAKGARASNDLCVEDEYAYRSACFPELFVGPDSLYAKARSDVRGSLVDCGNTVDLNASRKKDDDVDDGWEERVDDVGHELLDRLEVYLNHGTERLFPPPKTPFVKKSPLYSLADPNVAKPQTEHANLFADVDNSRTGVWKPPHWEEKDLPRTEDGHGLFMDESEGDNIDDRRRRRDEIDDLVVVAPPRHYPHPFRELIRSFEYQPEQLEVPPSSSFSNQPTKTIDPQYRFWIDTVEDLEKLANTLEQEDIRLMAVDLEHHSHRSFHGFTCLMQISIRRHCETNPLLSSAKGKTTGKHNGGKKSGYFSRKGKKELILTSNKSSSKEKQIMNKVHTYLIDTILLRPHIHRYLAPKFHDPRTVVVMHGAHSDVHWLQRDFGLYVVNLFDTYHASRLLQFPKKSLAYLLVKYVKGASFEKIIAKQKSRLRASDWRARPLSEEMMSYAAQDTHHLLDIYDILRKELSSATPSLSSSQLPENTKDDSFEKNSDENENDNKTMNNNDVDGSKPQTLTVSVRAVLDASRRVSLRRYTKIPFVPTGYRRLLSSSSLFSSTHIHGPNTTTTNTNVDDEPPALASLWDWRDRTARSTDESTVFVCPDLILLRIAKNLPSDVRTFLGLSSKHAEEIQSIVNDTLDRLRSKKDKIAPISSTFEKRDSMDTVTIKDNDDDDDYLDDDHPRNLEYKITIAPPDNENDLGLFDDHKGRVYTVVGSEINAKSNTASILASTLETVRKGLLEKVKLDARIFLQQMQEEEDEHGEGSNAGPGNVERDSENSNEEEDTQPAHTPTGVSKKAEDNPLFLNLPAPLREMTTPSSSDRNKKNGKKPGKKRRAEAVRDAGAYDYSSNNYYDVLNPPSTLSDNPFFSGAAVQLAEQSRLAPTAGANHKGRASDNSKDDQQHRHNKKKKKKNHNELRHDPNRTMEYRP